MLNNRLFVTSFFLVFIAATFAHADRLAEDKPIVLQKPVESSIEQGFGIEFNPLLQREQMNTGIAFTISGRQPVVAAADGVLSLRRTERDKVHLSIRHARGFESHYSNMSEALFDDGALVKKGDVIGYIDTQASRGMLYYEFFFRGNAIDPIPFFENRDFS